MAEKKKLERQFDPDLPPDNPRNREAARERKLVYDPHKKIYKDEDDCMIRDKFGQLF